MEFCLGTVQMGMQYGIQNNERPDCDETTKILSTALEKGVCWFDTSESYGDAENRLGEYVQKHPHQMEQMHIVSKLASNALLDTPRDRWRDTVLKHVQGTLNRLHKRQLDVYMFHNASSIFDSEAVEALDSVCQEGFAKMIGVSIYRPEEAMKALSYPQIGAIQIPYNVFDRRLDQKGFFTEAQKRDVRIYARSSLLQGAAVMEVKKLPDHMKFAAPYIEQFRLICENAGISPLQAAVGFVVNHPGIHYLVFGTDNHRQLLEYISVGRLPQTLFDELNGSFGQVEEKLVNPHLWNQ